MVGGPSGFEKKVDPDDFEMRVEYVHHAFSMLSGKCFWRVSGKCEKDEIIAAMVDCSIKNCPLLEKRIE